MLTKNDIITICGYIIAAGGLITGASLSTFHLTPDVTNLIIAIVAVLVGTATLIRNRLLNPSPPAGMVSANIPIGTVPQVEPKKEVTTP